MSTGSSRSSMRVWVSWGDALTQGRYARERVPGRRFRYTAFNARRATSAKYRAPTGRIASLKS